MILFGGGDGTDTLSETVSGTIDLDPLKLSGRFVDTLASIEKAILQGAESDDDINVYDFSNTFVDKGVTVIGGGGNDTITGGNGKDLLGGESGDDVIHGNKGSDTLSGGAGSDTINDSAGVDRIVESLATWSPEEAPIRDRIDVVVTAHGMKVTNRNSRVSQVDTWNGDFEIVNINGHNGKNSIDVSAFSDHLAKSEIGWVSADGRIGNDTLIGGLGSDNLIGGSGDDEIRGAAGHDTLSGGPGHDLLIGGPGTDLLHGDDDDDVIVGGPGDDRLYGGAGKDILVANLAQDAGIDSGIDVLDGGTGDDFLFVDANDQPVSGTGVATFQQVTTHSLPKTLSNRLELLRADAMSSDE
jgi:Ca2+-binding RTX toxin-like protein